MEEVLRTEIELPFVKRRVELGLSVCVRAPGLSAIYSVLINIILITPLPGACCVKD